MTGFASIAFAFISAIRFNLRSRTVANLALTPPPSPLALDSQTVVPLSLLSSSLPAQFIIAINRLQELQRLYSYNDLAQVLASRVTSGKKERKKAEKSFLFFYF
jgi:hypothetical protein